MTSAAHACARCATPLEEGDLRCAICGLTAPLLASAASRVVAKVLRCTECGAAIAYSAEVGAPRCAFCSSVMRVEEPVDPIEQAEHILPFLVMPDEAHERLRGWLRGLGFFRPGDLASSAALERVQPIFWAAWIVNADALVSFTADSDAGARRSAWAPHSGQTRLSFSNLLVSASRGLTSEEAFRLTHFYNLALAEPAPRGPMSAEGPRAGDSRAERRAPEGASIEQFDAQRSAARRTIIEAIRATASAELTQGVIPGSTFRNVHVSIVLHGFTTRRVALPTYILAYRYRDKTYRAIVHGQDGRRVIGDAPYSIGKILLVIALGLLAVAAIIAVIALAGAR
jgi:hypothetical protein